MSQILILLLSTLLFASGEFFLRARERQERHFISVLLFTTSLAFGQLFAYLDRLDGRIQSVSTIFSHLSSNALEQEFQLLYGAWEKNFPRPSPPMHEWVEGSLVSLRERAAEGYVYMPYEEAVPRMARLWGHANICAIATNVGGTATFFGGEAISYKRMNEQALERGIPSVRFYLFDPKKAIRLKDDGKDSDQVVSFDAFKDEVESIHESLGTTASYIINIADLPSLAVRDLLIIDGLAYAELLVDQRTWKPAGEARATESPQRVATALAYIRELYDAPKADQYYLKNVIVDTYFGTRYGNIAQDGREVLEEGAAARVLTTEYLERIGVLQ